MCSCCHFSLRPLKYWEKMKFTWFLIPNIFVGVFLKRSFDFSGKTRRYSFCFYNFWQLQVKGEGSGKAY